MCVLSVVGLKPGEVGDSVLLSRLERGCAPVTVHIPSSHLQVRTTLRSVAMGTQHRAVLYEEDAYMAFGLNAIKY